MGETPLTWSPKPPAFARDPQSLSSCATLDATAYPEMAQARPHAHRGMVVGEYRLVDRLGEGGVGEVWVAEHVELGDRVAIKLLLPELSDDPARVQRFLREGRLSAALEHPYIVEVREVGGTADAMPYLVMELLPGPSLEEAVEADGPLSWRRVQRMMLQLCEALAHAHRRSIVHHDVKPTNVVLAGGKWGADCCKLVDFGIARRNLDTEPDATLTFEGQLLGSPGYMSPEQLRGQRADHRSDLYGLGSTMFHLLTGRPPFEARNLPAVIHQTLFSRAPALRDIDVGESTRAAIEAVIHRALEKDPDARFASARQMARAIAAIDPC